MKKVGLIATVIAVASFHLISPPAVAATSTLGYSGGQASYASPAFGQTFTMPASGGDLVSISNIYVAFRGVTGLGVVQTKLYTSPAKTTLLATAGNTCSDNVTDYDNFQGVTCTFNFTGVTLSGSTQYFFEVARTSGEGSFYMWQSNATTYTGGDMYQNGSRYTGWDNQFTVTYNTITTANSSFSIADATFSFRKTSSVVFQSNVDGKARFRANGKNIGGCAAKLLTAGNSYTVTCAYRPTTRMPVTITIYFVPTDSNYTVQNFKSAQIKVTNRTVSRG